MPAPPRAISIATVLAIVGLVAMAAGWFLPWTARADMHGVGPSGSELDRMTDPTTNLGIPADVIEVARHLRDNGSATGRDLAVVGSYWVDHTGSHSPIEHRAWKIGLFAAKAAPFLAAFLALLLLMGRLRRPQFVVLGLIQAYALGIAGFAALLVLGASENARAAIANDPSRLGFGIYVIVVGCLAALFGALFSFRTSTWWKSLLLALTLVGGSIAAAFALAKPA